MGHPSERGRREGYRDYHASVQTTPAILSFTDVMTFSDSMEEASALANKVGILAKKMLGMAVACSVSKCDTEGCF